MKGNKLARFAKTQIFMISMLFGSTHVHQPKQGTKKLCTRIQSLNYLSCEPVIFIDINTYIPAKGRLFKTFFQENYAITCCGHIPMLNIYQRTVKHRIEHDIDDSAYEVCINALLFFTADSINTSQFKQMINFFFGSLSVEANVLQALMVSIQITEKHWNKVLALN